MKDLGHTIEWGGQQGLQEGVAWRKLYLVIVHCKSNAAAFKLNHHEKISISIEEKEHNASEYVKREKDTIRARRYKGSLPTGAVLFTSSTSGAP